MIKGSTDPKADLRKKLDIQIIPGTHWIRVALESTDPQEAAQIVNAVVDAFNENIKSFGTGVNKLLKTELETYKDKLEVDIEKVKTDLRNLAKNGNVVFTRPTIGARNDDPDQTPQPAFNSLTLDQFRSTKDLLMQTEFQLVELERGSRQSKRSCNRLRHEWSSMSRCLQVASESTGNCESGSSRSSSEIRKLPP